MVKRIVLWSVGAVVLAGLLVMARAGFFVGVRVEEKEAGPFTLVYARGEGAYKNAGDVMDAVYEKLILEKIEADTAFGYYYDTPRKVAPANLRWIAGFIVDNEKQAAAAKKYFRVERFSKTPALVAEFPLRGRLSIIAGMIKVYPAINHHAQKREFTMGPVMEIYDSKAKKIIYIMSLDPEYDPVKSLYETEIPRPSKKQSVGRTK